MAGEPSRDVLSAARDVARNAVLALDTATPRVSVAIARGARVLATREGAQRESSALLIGWIDEALAEAGLALGDLAGAVAASGPGSFTGLRVGLATLLGFHQAIGLRVTGIPTLALLAAAAFSARRVAALVPAGPGEWFAQVFGATWPPAPQGEPRRLPAAGLAAQLAGDGDAQRREAIDLLVVAAADEAARLRDLPWPVHVAGSLAPVVARLASEHPPTWDAATLRAPLYLAPPPVTVPGAPKPVLPLGEGAVR
ncbi:MAG TPA: tRNA (adenosine(37)-N6)-threonylcarbamoyltransferase complex dimerization subunit type 1 TsaB [Thermoanaerobaculia bacterium]|jgi:tRNA threonylcarbamoyl adenosine modification protein YeaZ|nr:tRNA (adenosine(37)-N6)-threonylcarbamoyltransferase complex dimerization subunit type 1 TsaB [Thermoanaerobaculia bacterium]